VDPAGAGRRPICRTDASSARARRPLASELLGEAFHQPAAEPGIGARIGPLAVVRDRQAEAPPGARFSVTRTVPLLLPGNAYLTAFVTSSFTMSPIGIAQSSNRFLFAGGHSTGKRFGEARDWGGIFGVTGRFRAAETALSRASGGKAAESQRLFRRRQETGVAQDCVVEPAGLEPATKRLWTVDDPLWNAPRRLGARKANDIVMLTWRLLQASPCGGGQRPQMVVVVTSSERTPFARMSRWTTPLGPGMPRHAPGKPVGAFSG
jgi:hypothetical protein